MVSGAGLVAGEQQEAKMASSSEAVRGTVPDPWEAFCEQLKLAGRVMHRETTPTDDLSQAEGYRKLARLIRVGLEASLEYADPNHPEVYQSVTSTTLGEGETSDARYHQAFIDGIGTYRVTGSRGEAPFIEFTVYAGKIGLDEHSRQIGALTEQQLVVNDDGSYELILSPERHDGNWIRTEPEASLLYIRQYAHDWSKTRGASFEIVRDGVEGHRPPLTRAEVEAALRKTASFVNRSVNTWAAIVDGAASRPPNVFVPFPEADTASSPEMPTGHRFASGHFRLAPDEALLVEFEPAEVPYWGIDLTNYWFEPLSYEDHRAHLNNHTVKTDPDGRVRIVIGAQARGYSNWIDTLGHREGMLLFRWSRTREPLPEITTKVVKLSDL